MKKITALLLVLCLAFCLLAGCGGSEPEDTGTVKKEAQTAEEPAAKPEAEPEAAFEPVSASAGPLWVGSAHH